MDEGLSGSLLYTCFLSGVQRLLLDMARHALVRCLVEEHISGACFREELSREVVSAEDAENAACDLAWIATDSMKASGLDYGPAFPMGWGEAVEKELEADPAADRAYLVAAIAHNAALIAAE